MSTNPTHLEQQNQTEQQNKAPVSSIRTHSGFTLWLDGLRCTRAIYRTLGLPTRTGVDKNKVLSYMQHDKKSAGSTITVIKVPGLGCWRADKIPMTELPALLGIKENED